MSKDPVIAVRDCLTEIMTVDASDLRRVMEAMLAQHTAPK
jgi:hypothetical protein